MLLPRTQSSLLKSGIKVIISVEFFVICIIFRPSRVRWNSPLNNSHVHATSLHITADGVDLDAASPRGPASTWTYLEEDVFKDPIAAALLSQRNIGFAVSAAMVGPLLMLWALVQRFQKRQR
jgi:hypothetical protein